MPIGTPNTKRSMAGIRTAANTEAWLPSQQVTLKSATKYAFEPTV